MSALYADAIKGYSGNWVPQVVTGSTSPSGATQGTQLLEYMGIKAARDLAVDLGMGKGSDGVKK